MISFYDLFVEEGTLTIVRRSSGKIRGSVSESFESPTQSDNPESLLPDHSARFEEVLDNVDLTTESLPAVDTPDACGKAALR